MEQELFDFAMGIPQALANFGNWLVSPIDPTYLNISPLALLGIGGTAVVISLIAIHVVKLFIP